MDPVSLSTKPVTVLLVDDQEIIAEGVRRSLSEEADIQFHYCQDPTKAIDMALEVEPTVILQDLVMPEVDGLVLLRYFRAHPILKTVPMIVLSTKEQPAIKAQAFGLGANDYLVKLPDKVELIARIRHHSQGYISLLQRNEAFRKLEESQQALLSELDKAANYVKSLLPDKVESPLVATWRFIPSEELGGDAFGYHWLDKDHFGIFLIDVCGHGVGAALLSVTVMNVLLTRSLPSCDFYDPKNVLTTLNATFPMEQQNNMFFTMWYGVVDLKKREITYASGGHPPAILLTGPSQDKTEVKELATEGLVIGALEDAAFESACCPLDTFAKLFVYSDGVYELMDPAGKLLRFVDYVKAYEKLPGSPEADLDYLLRYGREYQKKDKFDDDFSMMVFQF